MVQHQFWKNAVLTHVGPISGPKASHFQGILGFSMAQNASPQAQNGLKTIVSASQMVQHHFWKHKKFSRFLTHFWSENGPFSKHFGIFHGPKRVTTCSKWAKNTCLSIPNGPTSLVEKRVFDPFFTHFWSENSPFSRHFGIFHAPKRVTTGSKWAENTCLSIPIGPTSLLEKPVLDPFVTHHFGIFHGPQRVTMGSKWAKNTCLGIPNGPTSLLEQRVFDPFLVPKRPIFKPFWDFPWPKTRHHGLQMG